MLSAPVWPGKCEASLGLLSGPVAGAAVAAVAVAVAVRLALTFGRAADALLSLLCGLPARDGGGDVAAAAGPGELDEDVVDEGAGDDVVDDASDGGEVGVAVAGGVVGGTVMSADQIRAVRSAEQVARWRTSGDSSIRVMYCW